MKLMKAIKKLFAKPATVGEILDIYGILENDYTEVRTHTIAGRTFKVLWAVADENNGYKVVADGFDTKGKALARATEKNLILYPYEVEI